jgi:hypothetical protein
VAVCFRRRAMEPPQCSAATGKAHLGGAHAGGEAVRHGVLVLQHLEGAVGRGHAVRAGPREHAGRRHGEPQPARRLLLRQRRRLHASVLLAVAPRQPRQVQRRLWAGCGGAAQACVRGRYIEPQAETVACDAFAWLSELLMGLCAN